MLLTTAQGDEHDQAIDALKRVLSLGGTSRLQIGSNPYELRVVTADATFEGRAALPVDVLLCVNGWEHAWHVVDWPRLDGASAKSVSWIETNADGYTSTRMTRGGVSRLPGTARTWRVAETLPSDKRADVSAGARAIVSRSAQRNYAAVEGNLAVLHLPIAGHSGASHFDVEPINDDSTLEQMVATMEATAPERQREIAAAVHGAAERAAAALCRDMDRNDELNAAAVAAGYRIETLFANTARGAQVRVSTLTFRRQPVQTAAQLVPGTELVGWPELSDDTARRLVRDAARLHEKHIKQRPQRGVA